MKSRLKKSSQAYTKLNGIMAGLLPRPNIKLMLPDVARRVPFTHFVYDDGGRAYVCTTGLIIFLLRRYFSRLA